jgi:hypothetical protein
MVPEEIRLWRGDTAELAFELVFEDGSIVDLLGSELTLAAVWEGGSLTRATPDGISVPEPSAGLAYLTFTAEETAALPIDTRIRYELRRVFEGTRTTIRYGNIVVEDWVP